MKLRTSLPVVLLSMVSATSFALPPNAPKDLRPGANHHTGDDGFVADLGREPKPGEEKLRMHEHFVAVRARLAAAKAPKPELEAKRQKLISFLDAYIAKGTTPDNEHLPWRTPVFIDDKGTICAVGFLIEQSAGHEMAEKIAKSHRYSFIEDIAKDMPEVRDWVAASGFTLDELGQIQPGYQGPQILLWTPWTYAKTGETDKDSYDREAIAEGTYELDGYRGNVRHHKMEGEWTRRGFEGSLEGRGQFHRGAGSWTSFYGDGTKLAEGTYAANQPDGAWRFYHASGNLAAEGSMTAGQRTGAWRFYYDTADKTPIAVGHFSEQGYVTGTWKHYDAKGKLLATSADEAIPTGWDHGDKMFASTSFSLTIVPGPDGIAHRLHEGSISGDHHRLDELASKDGKEKVFLRYGSDDVFDATGHKLVLTSEGWRSDDCHWTKGEKNAAANGDLVRLHGRIWDGADDKCDEGKLISPERATRVAALVDSLKPVEEVDSKELQAIALNEKSPADLTTMIAANMAWDIEWPHIDGKFADVYKTIPGRQNRGY